MRKKSKSNKKPFYPVNSPNIIKKDQAAAKKTPPGQPIKPPVRVATPQQEMRQKINQNRSSSGGGNGKPTINAGSGETGSTAQKLQINS